jgi:hypothetical protein
MKNLRHPGYGCYAGSLKNHGEEQMKDAYTAVIKKSGKWWIAWIEEVPGVNCQEPSKK